MSKPRKGKGKRSESNESDRVEVGTDRGKEKAFCFGLTSQHGDRSIS